MKIETKKRVRHHPRSSHRHQRNGTATGEGADFLIVDDPHNPKQAESRAGRETVLGGSIKHFTAASMTKKME